MGSDSRQDVTIQIRRVLVDEVVDLRHEVLRQGLPRDSAIFAGDHDTESRHYGAFQGHRLIGCATLHKNPWQDEPAWQLRGMAVAHSHRGAGVGRQLLDFLESDVRAGSALRLLWANARVPALAFYEKLGWRVVSDVFDIPTAGPHRKIFRQL
jgi:GNAT superfamily N-acetyltransferase